MDFSSLLLCVLIKKKTKEEHNGNYSSALMATLEHAKGQAGKSSIYLFSDKIEAACFMKGMKNGWDGKKAERKRRQAVQRSEDVAAAVGRREEREGKTRSVQKSEQYSRR